MTIEVTRGAQPVRVAVEDHLATKMPVLIDQGREAWGLSPFLLPYPKRYDAWDPWNVQEYPIIGAYVLRGSNFRRLTNGALGSPYQPVYAVQVAVWVEDPRWNGTKFTDPAPERAMAVRDDLVAIMRAALLEYPNLEQPGVFTFEEGTYSEEYLPPARAQAEGNWVAGGLLSFQLKVNERNLLEGWEVGTAETIEVSIEAVGPAQPFPGEVE